MISFLIFNFNKIVFKNSAWEMKLNENQLKEIDEKGYLILDATYDQTEVQFGDTAYWVFDEDKLVPYDIKANINKGMLLIKVK